jgi:hypothetical protein
MLSSFSVLRVILYFCSYYGILCPNHTRELHFADWHIGLLSPSRVPNVAGRELFWLGLRDLRVVGILQIFYSRAVLQRSVADFSALLGDRFDGKDGFLCTYNPYVKEVGGLEVFLY